MPPKLRRVGAYAKLLANYALDDAIIEAGEAAELLFIRGLAFCATSDADGYITESQVIRYVGAGMRDALRRAGRLADVGLWERVDGGFVVRSWTKVHDTADERGRRLRADRERKQAVRADTASLSGRNPGGVPAEGATESLSLIHDTTDTRHDTTQHDTAEPSLRGGRPETPQPPNATNRPPQKRTRCTRHPNGNPTDQPCAGCGRDREADDRAQAAAEAAAARRAEAAARACTRCDGVWVLNDQQQPTRHKCNHHKAAS